MRGKQNDCVHGSVGPFDSSSEDWSSYAERLQQYFKANDVADEDKKRAILLSNSGPQTYQLVKNPLAPAKPTKNTFTDIVAVLKEHWQPKPSEIVQQYNLCSRLQKEGQSIADYVADLLYRLLEHCGFKENTFDDMLCDRLVCGVKDTCIQKKLLTESDLTFKKTYRMVQAVEAAEWQLTELQDNDEAGHPVHLVQDKKSTDLTQGNCYQCGGSRQLRVLFQGSIMYRVCGKTGHIARACWTKNDKPQKTGSQGKPTQKPARTHCIKKDSSDEKTSTDEEYSSPLYSISDSQWSKPLVVTPRLNGTELKMEIDTRASLSLISEETYHKVWEANSASPMLPSTASQKYAILLTCGKLLQPCSDVMANYCSVCRRTVLFQEFDDYSRSPNSHGCQCCDICLKTSKCGQCKSNIEKELLFRPQLFGIK